MRNWLGMALLTYICRQCRCQFWWGLGSWQMVFCSVLGGKEISKRRFGKQVREVRGEEG